MTISSNVTKHLEQLGVLYRVIEIPLAEDRKPVRSLEEIVEAQGGQKAQIVRSLLFRTKSVRDVEHPQRGGQSGKFVLLALPSGRKVDWGALRHHLGEKRMTMASPEEVLEATGYPVGAVPPLALPERVRLLVDESAFEHDPVVIGSGVLGYALELACDDSRRALPPSAEIGKFSKG